ncbi:MAG: inositol monophosphatase family protein [Alphaproteobacteria bacterium]
MTEDMFKKRFQYAQEIALRAGDMALDYFKKCSELKIEQKKNHQDLVSEADKEIETFVQTCIADQYPEDNILGEEDGLIDNQGDVTWVVDPIDGTYAFLHGIPFWCISIAALHHGEPIFGVIVDPNHQEIYTAFKGEGAFCNGNPIYCLKDATLQSASVAFGIDKGKKAELAEKFIHESIKEGVHIARTYTCALNMAWTAAGRIMASFYPYVSSWDFCAGLILIEEAGGRHNSPLKQNGLYEGGALLASASDVYDELFDLCQMKELEQLK